MLRIVLALQVFRSILVLLRLFCFVGVFQIKPLLLCANYQRRRLGDIANDQLFEVQPPLQLSLSGLMIRPWVTFIRHSGRLACCALACLSYLRTILWPLCDITHTPHLFCVLQSPPLAFCPASRMPSLSWESLATRMLPSILLFAPSNLHNQFLG